MLAAHERSNALRHVRIDRAQHAVNAGRRIEDDALRPLLVVRGAGDRVLEQMREWTVTDVVEERGGQRVLRAIGRDLLPERELAVDAAETREQELHDVRGADRVSEPRVLRAGERVRRD